MTASLRRQEKHLEEAWTRLREDGHGYAGVLALLADEKLDTEERRKSLRAADEAQRAFLARLDDWQRETHTTFMNGVVGELEQAMQTLREFYGPRRHRRLVRRHRSLAALADRYRELEPLYGTPQDHKRITVFQRFYAGVVEFSRRVRELDPTMPRRASPSLLEDLYRLRRGVAWLAGRSRALARVLWAALCIVGSVFRKRQPERGTPLTNRVDELFRALGEVQGRTVSVTGRPVIEEGDDAVTLWTPTHRHGVTDNITFSHLRLPDYLVFNAVDQVQLVPQWLKDRAAANNGLIPVGGGRGPSVERALEKLGQGVSSNILIYPEGSVSEGFRGTRPPRSNFGEKLVPAIREAGRRVRIVPIAYLDNARFLDLPPRSKTAEDRALRVTVGQPLECEAVDALLAAGGGTFLNGMVRLAWLESLATDENRFLGHDRARTIDARLDRELDGIRYWGSLESMPVADRLEIVSDDPITVSEEPFHGQRVRVLRIPDSARDESGRIPLPGLRASDSGELLIGIRPPSHIYLNAGRQRFDGDIFRYLKILERDTINPGILIRFVGVPVKSLNAIRSALEELAGREQRTLTCANSACQVIAKAANLEIDDHADLRPFLPSHVLPTRTIRKLIERGVRNHMGDTMEIQIYKTDDRSLEEILAECRRQEIRIALDHVRMLTTGAARRGWSALRGLFGRKKG